VSIYVDGEGGMRADFYRDEIPEDLFATVFPMGFSGNMF
jgi:hypothetical protein